MKFNSYKLVLIPFLLFFSATLVIMFLLNLVSEDLSGWKIMLGYILPMILTIWITLKIFHIKIFVQKVRLTTKQITAIILTYLILLIITNLFISFFPQPGDELKMIMDLIKNNPLFGLVVLVLAAPVLEEILFRRIILHFLLTRQKPLYALLISSLAFAFFHMNIWQGIAAFVMGMYFGYIYWRTKSLPVVIFLHFLTNLLGFLSVYYHNEPDIQWENYPAKIKIIWILFLLPVFYFMFNHLRKLLVSMPQHLYLATANPHKIKEIKSILPPNYKLHTLKELGFKGEIPEPGKTIEENSYLKAKFITDTYGVNTLADDTGLEVEALGNKPGVHSARYAGEKATDEMNRKKLLEELLFYLSRKARFKTVLTWINGPDAHQFEGTVEGEIAKEEKGENGFGYDPLFIPEGYDKTFGEMTPEEKNKISHRRRALEAFKNFLSGRKTN